MKEWTGSVSHRREISRAKESVAGVLHATFGLLAVVLLLIGCASAQPGFTDHPVVTPEPRATELESVADGPLGDFQGVLVQRTTHFETTNSNDSIPDFDRQVYDTNGAWSPEQPDRLVVPWDGPVIFTARAAWAGHVDRWVELKLYCGATRPIGNDQEDKLVAVIQEATNPDSPFLELTSAPTIMQAGTECFLATKTPDDRLLISYQGITTLFGAYLP